MRQRSRWWRASTKQLTCGAVRSCERGCDPRWPSRPPRRQGNVRRMPNVRQSGRSRCEGAGEQRSCANERARWGARARQPERDAAWRALGRDVLVFAASDTAFGLSRVKRFFGDAVLTVSGQAVHSTRTRGLWDSMRSRSRPTFLASPSLTPLLDWLEQLLRQRGRDAVRCTEGARHRTAGASEGGHARGDRGAEGRVTVSVRSSTCVQCTCFE